MTSRQLRGWSPSLERLEGRIALSGAGLAAAGPRAAGGAGGPILAAKPTPGGALRSYDTNGDGKDDLKIFIGDRDGDGKADTVGIDKNNSGDFQFGSEFFERYAVVQVTLQPRDGFPGANAGGLRIKIVGNPIGGGPAEEHEFLAFDRNGDGDCDDPDEFVGS